MGEDYYDGLDDEELTWTTKDGQELLISEMGESHIRNCINQLHRRLENRPSYMPYMGDSDLAESWAESEEEYNERLGEEMREYIDHFEEELKSRGLTSRL